VFHKLHVLWMCICICPYHVTTALVGHLLKVAINSVTIQGANQTSVVWWLRLYTHSSGLLLQQKTDVRCFTTFICCECVYMHLLLPWYCCSH
jgi:hypothetical protein